MSMIDPTEARLKELEEQLAERDARFIIITGGVMSGLGKGILAASIGALIRESRIQAVPFKCEGYLNVDPGTMNPYEHGEVFVLDDGEEADMDFGHYERFMNVSCRREWNITMGKVFQRVIQRERDGYYLGRTVQYYPHVVSTILEWWYENLLATDARIALIEIGGTVGDVETELHLEAARRLLLRWPGRSMLVHLVYVPIPPTLGEQKTKPAQQSLILLRERGLTPAVLIARSPDALTEKARVKLSIFSGLPEERILSSPDVKSVYDIPLLLEEQGMPRILQEELGLSLTFPREKWEARLNNLHHPRARVRIAIGGKYTSVEDSYVSILEALTHATAETGIQVEPVLIETSDLDTASDTIVRERLRGMHGLIIPGGFGTRGVEGKIRLLKAAREMGLPTLGICYGMQLMIVEHARNVLGLVDAHTTEVDPDTPHPVITILPGQEDRLGTGGSMRLGAYPAIFTRESLAWQLYQQEKVVERHRHRYEVNPDYHDQLEREGLRFSGWSPDHVLVEFAERTDHPYYIGTQAHPELTSRFTRPAPLFLGLVKAAYAYKKKPE